MDEAVKFLTAQQVAGQLGIGYSTVMRMAKSGQIPSVMVGRRRLVPASYVEHLLAEARDSVRGDGERRELGVPERLQRRIRLVIESLDDDLE